MKKRFFVNLLGGGVVSSLAVLSGIVINDLNRKNALGKKIFHYQKLSNKFNQNVKRLIDDDTWYMPNWENNQIWEKQYKLELKRSNNKDQFKSQFPSPRALRDYCFESAKKIFEYCLPHEGWCHQCIRLKEWENIKV